MQIRQRYLKFVKTSVQTDMAPLYLRRCPQPLGGGSVFVASGDDGRLYFYFS